MSDSFDGKLLERDISIAQTSEIREMAGPVLRNVVDESIGLLGRSFKTSDDQEHKNFVALMSFHHVIEMLDGVEVMLDKSCVVASQTALRSAFEASLIMRHVLADTTEDNALRYIAHAVSTRIEWLEEYAPGHKDIPGLRLQLSQAPYAETRGLMKVKQLAESLGQIDDYKIIYWQLSNVAHGTDLMNKMIAKHVAVIRSPLWMKTVYGLSISMGLESIAAVMEYYRPDERGYFGEWFEGVRPVAEQLTQDIPQDA